MRQTFSEWIKAYGTRNFHVLLGVLLVLIFLQGFAGTSELVRYGSRAGVLVVLLAALRVISSSRASSRAGVGAVLLWLALQIPSWIWGSGRSGEDVLLIDDLARLADVLAFAWIIIALVLVLMRAQTVGAQELSASLCAYLLLGIWFFSVYALLGEDEFLPPPDEVEARMPNGERGDLFYFSFVTLTSLGYGDVTPATPLARSLTILEVVLGQFYLAVLIARQVGLYLVNRRDGDDREAAS